MNFKLMSNINVRGLAVGASHGPRSLSTLHKALLGSLDGGIESLKGASFLSPEHNYKVVPVDSGGALSLHLTRPGASSPDIIALAGSERRGYPVESLSFRRGRFPYDLPSITTPDQLIQIFKNQRLGDLISRKTTSKGSESLAFALRDLPNSRGQPSILATIQINEGRIESALFSLLQPGVRPRL